MDGQACYYASMDPSQERGCHDVISKICTGSTACIAHSSLVLKEVGAVLIDGAVDVKGQRCCLQVRLLPPLFSLHALQLEGFSRPPAEKAVPATGQGQERSSDEAC